LGSGLDRRRRRRRPGVVTRASSPESESDVRPAPQTELVPHSRRRTCGSKTRNVWKQPPLPIAARINHRPAHRRANADADATSLRTRTQESQPALRTPVLEENHRRSSRCGVLFVNGYRVDCASGRVRRDGFFLEAVRYDVVIIRSPISTPHRCVEAWRCSTRTRADIHGRSS